MIMQTLNFSIDIPQDKVIDIALVRQKILDYATRLISFNTTTQMVKEDEEMGSAMKFIDSLTVSGGQNIPVYENGTDALVEQKYRIQ